MGFCFFWILEHKLVKLLSPEFETVGFETEPAISFLRKKTSQRRVDRFRKTGRIVTRIMEFQQQKTRHLYMFGCHRTHTQPQRFGTVPFVFKIQSVRHINSETRGTQTLFGSTSQHAPRKGMDVARIQDVPRITRIPRRQELRRNTTHIDPIRYRRPWQQQEEGVNSEYWHDHNEWRDDFSKGN